MRSLTRRLHGSAGACVIFLFFAGCAKKTNDAALVVGTWKSDSDFTQSFHEDGVFDYTYGAKQGHGAFKLERHGDIFRLALCIDGAACGTGEGLWSSNEVRLSGDRMTYVAGGAVWRRVSPKP